MLRTEWLLVLLLTFGLSFDGTYAQPPNGSPSQAGEIPDGFEGDPDAFESPDAVLRTDVRPSMLRRGAQSTTVSATEQGWISDNCQFGMPEGLQGADLGPIQIVPREGYVLGHSALSRIPYWVCEHSVPSELSGPGDRDNSKFKPDPKLGGQPRAVLADYKGSGYDRGHMAPAANHKKTQDLMNETFFLSNMVPQFGPTFNRGIWAELESLVRDWTKKRGECWIISGPMFYDPLEEDDATADGLVPYFTIGDGEVAVPTHCYKIVLSKNESGEWEALAFVFANVQHATPYRPELHRATVSWIEDRTGLDFFPELSKSPSHIQLKNRLEAQKSAMWERN